MVILGIILMSIAIALMMALGRALDEGKFGRVCILFLFAIIFFCSANIIQHSETYKKGLIDGAREQLRGNTEIKITIDENNIPVDTIITVNKKYIDVHL
jgi:K+-transporting ATPase A subunit